MQRLGKHVPAKTNTRATIQERCFRRGSPRSYIVRTSCRLSRVEAGSNTPTVTLRVLGGDEEGSLKSETVNYGHESHGSRTRKCLHWQGP
jgi:hypothetical protein